MTQHVTERLSVSPILKWLSLAVAIICTLLLLVTPRLGDIKRITSTPPLSSSSLVAAPFVSGSPASASSASKLSFTRDGWIYLKDLRTGTETKLLEGSWPDLSPDGKAIVFMSGADTDATDKWRMRLLDLSSFQVREFKSLANRRVLSGGWSNDSTKIAFRMTDPEASRLDIVVLDPAKDELRNLTENLAPGYSEGGIDFDSWAPGDHSILFHNAENLYEVAVDGTLVGKHPIAHLQISSRTKFSLSPDRKYLLFDTIVDTPERPLNEVVMMLNLATKDLVTVTPKTIEASHPEWLPHEKRVLFTCLKRLSPPPYRESICSIGVDGEDLRVLAKDAKDASVSIE
jgi:hypothetical protein